MAESWTGASWAASPVPRRVRSALAGGGRGTPLCIVVVGDGELASDVAGLAGRSQALRVLGRFAECGDAALLAACHRRQVDLVVLALPSGSAGEVQRAVDRLAALDVGLLHCPDRGGLRALTGEAEGALLAPVGPTRRERLAKALLDRGVAAVAVLLLLPLLVLIAVSVRLTSAGPAVFRQWRIGEGGRSFRILKFRTMRWNPGGQDGRIQSMPGDRRVTRVGRFLRQTSLDELPQLLNVLGGSMSLVGPRPHPVAMLTEGRTNAEAAPGYMRRYRAKPGITGLAQINGHRGATGTAEALQARLRDDLEYVAARSFTLDMRILLLTPARLLRHRNRAF